MPEKDIQAGPHLPFIDIFLSKTILRLIPRSISPNSVTVVRFIFVPVIIVFLVLHMYVWGVLVFAAAVCTDALDGAMARTRKQITQWGKIADPLADKLLIGATALILVPQYVGIMVTILLVGTELLLATRAVYMYMHGRNAGANAVGKIKMVSQSAALLSLFVFVLSGLMFFLILATWGLYTAIFLALVSLLLAPSA